MCRLDLTLGKGGLFPTALLKGGGRSAENCIVGIGERQRFSTNGPMQSTVCPTAILHLCKLSLLHIGGEKARKCTSRDPRHAGRLSYKDRRRRRGRVSDLSLAPPMTHFGSSSWEINRGAYGRTRLPKEKGYYPKFWTLGATLQL